MGYLMLVSHRLIACGLSTRKTSPGFQLSKPQIFFFFFFPPLSFKLLEAIWSSGVVFVFLFFGGFFLGFFPLKRTVKAIHFLFIVVF